MCEAVFILMDRFSNPVIIHKESPSLSSRLKIKKRKKERNKETKTQRKKQRKKERNKETKKEGNIKNSFLKGINSNSCFVPYFCNYFSIHLSSDDWV